jgi:hypothetical protein
MKLVPWKLAACVADMSNAYRIVVGNYEGTGIKQSHYMPWRRLGERRYSSYSF